MRSTTLFYLVITIGIWTATDALAQPEDVARLAQPAPSKKSWTERLSIRGYSQLRYSTPRTSLVNENDRSVGNNTNLVLRRARVIISGEASDLLSIYIQPDFGTSAGDSQLIPQLRDFYGDIFFDQSKHYRLRAGLSKVPFGFENLQSSQNRLALDRADPINTAVKDERDLGVFFYWETASVRARFKELVDRGLKGSGDYGIVGLGLYNGQTLSRREANNNMHMVARITYPFELGSGQYFEPGLSAYSGIFEVNKSTTGAPSGGNSVSDKRVAVHAVWYPQPLGFQAEYNVGRGPELNGSAIEVRPLRGGYIQTMYKIDNIGEALTPFVRYQYYRGGRKAETNAPSNFIRQTELGLEWQATKAVELTAQYEWAHRTTLSDSLIRFQLQLNY